MSLNNYIVAIASIGNIDLLNSYSLFFMQKVRKYHVFILFHLITVQFSFLCHTRFRSSTVLIMSGVIYCLFIVLFVYCKSNLNNYLNIQSSLWRKQIILTPNQRYSFSDSSYLFVLGISISCCANYKHNIIRTPWFRNVH